MVSARCCCRDDSLTLCIGDVVSSRSCCLGCARGDLLPDGAPLERVRHARLVREVLPRAQAHCAVPPVKERGVAIARAMSMHFFVRSHA